MEIFRVVGIAVIGAVSAVLLRHHRPEFGMLISLCTGMVILAIGLHGVEEALLMITQLLQRGGIDEQYAGILFKALGICIVTQIASDACRDSGENAIASKVELVGKLAVLTVSLPLFYQILSISAALLAV